MKPLYIHFIHIITPLVRPWHMPHNIPVTMTAIVILFQSGIFKDTRTLNCAGYAGMLRDFGQNHGLRWRHSMCHRIINNQEDNGKWDPFFDEVGFQLSLLSPFREKIWYKNRIFLQKQGTCKASRQIGMKWLQSKFLSHWFFSGEARS